MKNTTKLFGLMLSAAVLAAVPAFAADVAAENKGKYEAKDNGGYIMKGEASEKLADGTEKSAKTKVDVNVDSEGKVTKKAEKETTTNPEGSMNEKKTVSKTETKEKDHGGYEKKTVEKNTDADGTDTKMEASTDVEVDSHGKVIEKSKTVKTTDPKGLFNQEKSVTSTKKVDGKVVEQKSEH